MIHFPEFYSNSTGIEDIRRLMNPAGLFTTC